MRGTLTSWTSYLQRYERWGKLAISRRPHVEGEPAHRGRRVKLLRHGDERNTLGVQSLDDLGKVCERAGQAIDLVNDDGVDTWTKTNIATHINHVMAAGWLSETRVIKLWRNQKGLDFPSFYLELVVVRSLAPGIYRGNLASNVWKVFQYLNSDFPLARIQDPANTNNIISDDLSAAERGTIKAAAAGA